MNYQRGDRVKILAGMIDLPAVGYCEDVTGQSGTVIQEESKSGAMPLVVMPDSWGGEPRNVAMDKARFWTPLYFGTSQDSITPLLTGDDT